MEKSLLRHYTATLAYRGNIAMEDAPAAFPSFEAGNGVMTPLQLLQHISAVLTKGYKSISDKQPPDLPSEDWEQAKERFFRILELMDQAFREDAAPQGLTEEQLLQGPLADAMTHIGQLATLRRLAGSPIRGGNYIRADIRAGQIRP